jgi:hypothetical protein
VLAECGAGWTVVVGAAAFVDVFGAVALPAFGAGATTVRTVRVSVEAPDVVGAGRTGTY